MQNLIILSLTEYLPILIFIAIAFTLAVFVFILPKILAISRPDKEKLSPYECGFEPFSDSRKQFDVRFYLVAILFIIFDLEIMFLFPWSVTLAKTGSMGFYAMMFFLLVLILGFIYEWKKGALEWE